MQAPTSAFKSGLPTHISGIVFWGAVLIGLIIAAIVLENKEQELAARQRQSADILSMVIVKSLEYTHPPYFSADSRLAMERNLQPFRDTIKCDAIEIKVGSDLFVFGDKKAGQDAITSQLAVNPVFPDVPASRVETIIYFPSINQAMSDYRKPILLSIALLSMLFGFAMQYILHRLLTRPFLAMVDSARNFAEGQTSSRFDESSSNEFGFLAKFINRALDSSVHNQEKLSEALARVTQSESALFAEKMRIEVTLRSISDAVITTDANFVVDYMNPIAEQMTGWSIADARGQHIDRIIHFAHETSHTSVMNPVYACLQNNITASLGNDAALLAPQGQMISIEASAAPMRNDQGSTIGAVMVCKDVSQSRKLALQLSYQASHDSLTNLYNRLAFEEKLNRLLVNTSGTTTHALLYVDLDQFKIVNDTCGHSAGDELLRQLAKILHGCIRHNDFLARLGGDEFGVLLSKCDVNNALEIADKLRQAVKSFRFSWLDSSFEISASIGLVEINAENLNASNIMSAADLACYAAKDGGRNRIHIYERTDDALLQRHGEMHWTTMITQALEEDRLILFHQPIVPINDANDTMLHWEILVRMRGKDGTIISPASFLPAAERYNQMGSIDRWVIHKLFSLIQEGAFASSHPSQLLFSVNLSGSSLGDKEMLDYIRDTGKKFEIDFTQICFEITETVAISNLSKATDFITELKKMGCSFSLDDFGSGLSSFGYLKNLPVDYLKIDGSFVVDMATEAISCAMVEAINQIGHVMQIKTIAEWVENEETLALLRERGINYAQGYHTGKPVPIASTLPDSIVKSQE